jgi:hypothetical protein
MHEKIIPQIVFLFLYFFFICCEKKEDLENKNRNLVESKNQKNVKKKSPKHQSGDIIFQISQSGQGKAIQLATKSLYTHCGMIYEIDNKFFVYEAVQPVTLTPLEDWINRGQKNHFLTKRLKNADEILTKNTLEKMQKIAKSFQGKNYDILFGWSDENMYCSELVWKIYKQATNIEVGKCQLFKEFDLSSQEVQNIMKSRYGKKIPLEENVISPVAILKSEHLETIFGEELK